MVGQLSWSPQCPIINVFYDARVAPGAMMPTQRARRYSASSLKKALWQVEAEKGERLTLREAEAVGDQQGASRKEARDAWRAMVPDELRRPGQSRAISTESADTLVDFALRPNLTGAI
jgi:hypothetical protein